MDTDFGQALRSRGILLRTVPQANGPCEKAVQDVVGQLRTLKIGLETRLKCKVEEDANIMQWALRHAAFILNKYSVGHDGKTPHER